MHVTEATTITLEAFVKTSELYADLVEDLKGALPHLAEANAEAINPVSRQTHLSNIIYRSLLSPVIDSLKDNLMLVEAEFGDKLEQPYPDLQTAYPLEISGRPLRNGIPGITPAVYFGPGTMPDNIINFAAIAKGNDTETARVRLAWQSGEFLLTALALGAPVAKETYRHQLTSPQIWKLKQAVSDYFRHPDTHYEAYAEAVRDIGYAPIPPDKLTESMDRLISVLRHVPFEQGQQVFTIRDVNRYWADCMTGAFVQRTLLSESGGTLFGTAMASHLAVLSDTLEHLNVENPPDLTTAIFQLKPPYNRGNRLSYACALDAIHGGHQVDLLRRCEADPAYAGELLVPADPGGYHPQTACELRNLLAVSATQHALAQRPFNDRHHALCQRMDSLLGTLNAIITEHDSSTSSLTIPQLCRLWEEQGGSSVMEDCQFLREFTSNAAGNDNIPNAAKRMLVSITERLEQEISNGKITPPKAGGDHGDVMQEKGERAAETPPDWHDR